MFVLQQGGDVILDPLKEGSCFSCVSLACVCQGGWMNMAAERHVNLVTVAGLCREKTVKT